MLKNSPHGKKMMAFLAMLLIVAAGVMSQMSSQGKLLGFRDEFQPLSADNVWHYVALQNPRNKKYFLRMAVQKPENFLGLLYAPHPMFLENINAVHVMAKGLTSSGSSFVRRVRNVKFSNPYGEGGFPEYFIHRSQLAPPLSGGHTHIAVDVEMKFPAAATNAEKRGAFVRLAETSAIQLVDSKQFWPRAIPGEDDFFWASLDSVLPK